MPNRSDPQDIGIKRFQPSIHICRIFSLSHEECSCISALELLNSVIQEIVLDHSQNVRNGDRSNWETVSRCQ